MMMNKVKVRNKKTGVIKEVEKAMASDFIGTGEFELVENKKVEPKKPSNFNLNREEQ